MSDETIKTIVVFLGVACTLGIYSILYKENKVFRLFEHVYLGLAAGYGISQTWTDVLKPQWWDMIFAEGKWWYAMALPAGLMFYLIYSKKHAWMSRVIYGLFFGAAAGTAFQSFAAEFFPQLAKAASKGLVNLPEATKPDAYALTPFSAALNNVLFILILAAVMTYFFFSFEQKGKAIKTTSKFGRYVLMMSFGALFGSTIMARMSLLIGRMYFLIHDFVIVKIFHGQ